MQNQYWLSRCKGGPLCHRKRRVQAEAVERQQQGLPQDGAWSYLWRAVAKADHPEPRGRKTGE